MPIGVVVRAILKVAGWRLRGLAWPNPYFERGKTAPIYPVRVLTPSERDALRPLCGPRPAVGGIGVVSRRSPEPFWRLGSTRPARYGGRPLPA